MIINNGVDYNSFKESALADDIDMINNKYDQQDSFFCAAKEKISDRLTEINQKINIAVFSSTKCPDAATATPILLELGKLNENIHISFYDKEENEDFLLENLNEAKIPTFLNIGKDGSIISKYCEFPLPLKKVLSSVKYREDADTIITDFRNGRYNNELLNELVGLILGSEQPDYISFNKKALPYKNKNVVSK